MAGSILDELKSSLALASDYTAFDSELIIHINSVLADLYQLGIGPEAGLEITDTSSTWEDLFGVEPRLNAVKSYMTLRIKMLFDPPSLGYLITAYEKMIEKAEWRITVAQDEIINPIELDVTVPTYEDDTVDWGEVTVISGGTV